MEVDVSTCETSSVENDGEDEFDEEDVAELNANPKLADALNKVLRMSKRKSHSKSIVLSKAKLHGSSKKNIKVEKCSFQIEPNPNHVTSAIKEEEDVKPDIKEDKDVLKKTVLAKHERLTRGRIIPHILEREKERHLAKIATRGVVQLFNAVRQQQLTIDNKFKEKKLTESKKEKVLKSIDRKAFLNALSGSVVTSSNMEVDKPEKTEIKDEELNEEDEEKPKWEILRNDFMMNPKLRDWDKKQDDEDVSDN